MDDQFFELGGTSLMGLTIVARLAEELDVPLTAADLFTAPTPAALAEVVAGRLGDGQAGADTRPPGEEGGGRGTRRRSLAAATARRRATAAAKGDPRD